MQAFMVRIEGRDFPARLSDDGQTCLGFFTTRFVEAKNAADAERAAVSLIRDELSDWVGPPQEGDAVPSMILSEIFQIDALPTSGTGRGFTWYPMDAKDRATDVASLR